MTWADFLSVVLIPIVKIGVIIGAVLGSVPIMVLAERKIIGRVQNRPGPNRVGPWGILQTIVDGIKLLFKEDFMPAMADKWLYLAAPILAFMPALLLLAIVPFGPDLPAESLPAWLGIVDPIRLGIADLNIGMLFYLAITSVAVYGIILAGWSSTNKYSLLGGLRSSAQMVSYELPLGLSVVGIFLLCGSFNLDVVIESQKGGLLHWHVMSQPLAFVLFLMAGFAETNRLPFDLPEGESELTGGFHTEYSSMKFAMFFMAEYANMFVFAALITTMFLGGYTGPIDLGLQPGWVSVAAGLFWFAAKVAFFIVFFIYIRATWPRFRYDQLMALGWKLMFPLALGNVVVTALVIAVVPSPEARTVVLFLLGAATFVGVDRYLTRMRRRQLDATA
jgi:NADH-quinone oxidoreductase subunit H